MKSHQNFRKNQSVRGVVLFAIVSLALVFLPSALPGAANYPPSQSEGSGPARQVQITEAAGLAQVTAQDAEGGQIITVDVNVSSLQQEIRQADSDTFQLLSIAGYQYLEEIGKPQLPMIREIVGIPDGATVEARIVDVSYSTYQGFKIYPAQIPLTDSEQQQGFVIDEDFYTENGYYPEGIVQLDQPAIWRDITVAGIQVHPVLFNPATGDIRVYDYIQIELVCSDGTVIPKTVSPMFDQMYRSKIINYNDLVITAAYLDRAEMLQNTVTATDVEIPEGCVAEDYGSAGTPYETDKRMLYIRDTSVTSYAALAPLLEWHRAEGINWYGYASASYTKDSIKTLITNYYNAHPELEYVLLVGDVDELPWQDNWGTAPSPDDLPGDHWYSCITGGADPDFYADVAIGRLSVNNTAELTQIVNKTLAYAKNPPIGTWVNRTILAAYDQWNYINCSEDIRTAAYTDPFTFITQYGDTAGVTNGTVNTQVNNGVGILQYRGHGCFGDPNPRPWGTFWAAQDDFENLYGWNQTNQVYDTPDAHALTNGAMTPIVFCITCMNNALDNGTTGECLGEAFVKQSDGAVAFLGATRPSLTTPNQSFAPNLFDAIGNEGITRLGWLFNDANGEIVTSFGTGSSAIDNVKIYLWHGDPAIDLWTSTPIRLNNTTHATSVTDGVLTVTVKSQYNNPVSLALVSIFKNGDIYDYKYTNGSGQATFAFLPGSDGTLEITATKHNYVPYEGTADVYTLTNNLTNIVFTPASPASMDNSERVYMDFDYTTTDTGGIRVQAMPFTGDDPTPNWSVNGQSVAYPYPSGSEQAFFRINSGDAVIDRVRLTMYDDGWNPILEVFTPVDFTYGHSVHNVTMTPSSPESLKWGEDIDVEFDYYTPEDGYIYVRPYTGGSLTPGWSGDGGLPCSPGRGNGTRSFSINSGQNTVDTIRVYMYNSTFTTILFDIDIPVNYLYEGDPDISVTPSSFDFTVKPWGQTQDSFRIYNYGNGELHYDMRDRADTQMDMDISREGISRFAPYTGETSPDNDGILAPEPIETDDYQLDGVLMDLSGVSVAYDLSHGERNASSLDGMKEELTDRDAIIEYINTGPITENLLEPFDILWVDEGSSTWTASELTAVQNWVAKGRGLLIHGDQPGGASALSALFGITFTGSAGSGGYSSDINAHDITEDVSQVYLNSPMESLSVSAPGATIVYDDEGDPTIAVADYVTGRVVVLAEDYFWGAYLQYADNELMANQAFDWLVPDDSSWLTLSPRVGSVPTSGTNWDEIELMVDATQMGPGEYYADITITNDDPDENPTHIPVHLTVLPPDEEFSVAVTRSWSHSVFDHLTNNWFLYGPTKLTIDTSLIGDTNMTYADLSATGADVLWIANPASKQYSSAEIQAIEQYANAGHSLLGTYMVFQYMSADNRALAPLFGLDENTSYNTSLVFCDQTFDVLHEYPMFNNVPSPYDSDGNPYAQVPADDSSWDVGDWGDALLLAQTPDNCGIVTYHQTPNYHAVFVSERVEYSGNEDDHQFVYNTLTLPGPDTKKYLILTTDVDDYIADTRTKILNSGRLDGMVDIYHANTGTPSLATLEYYDSVLVYSNSPSFDDDILLGDRLADYVDGGGGVVVMTFTNASISLAGRWATNAYDPILPDLQSSGSSLTLGTIHSPLHPALKDVASFDGGSSSYHGTGGVNAEGTLIAEWSNGKPLIAEMQKFVGRVLSVNFFPPSSDARSDFWDATTDGDILMANALNYVSDGMLTTTFAGGNSNNGAMFDIEALNFIEITGFDYSASSSTAPGSSHTIEVYYVTNRTTYQGKENVPAAWTLLGSQTVSTAPYQSPTHVDIGGLKIMPGETVGIYITANNTSDRIAYTTGSATYHNGDLIINAGTGKGYPFANSFANRIWNGTVYYNTSGPTNELYLTAGFDSVNHVIQGSQVNRSWAQSSQYQFPLAVLETARILGRTSSDTGAEYLLDGTQTGITYNHALADAVFYDGTTDGTNNYAWDYANGIAYQFDLNWANPVSLFTLGIADGKRLGITYDPANHSLWLTGFTGTIGSVIENRSISGTLLSSFTVAHSLNSALALDPTDGTLWLFDRNTHTTLPAFEQYSRDGVLLDSQTYPGLFGDNILGGEFAAYSHNPADQNGDGCVTLMDVAIFCSQWLDSGNPLACTLTAELAGDDCLVNFLDYAFLAAQMDQCGNPAYNFDYWVDASLGDDNNTGSRDYPFKTITHALAAAGENQSIKVMPGTYDTANGETFPFYLQPGQNLIGDAVNKGSGAVPTLIYGSGAYISTWFYTDATIVGAEESKILGFQLDAAYLNKHTLINSDTVSMQIFNNTFMSGAHAGVLLDSDSRSVVENNIFNTSTGVHVHNCLNMPVIKNNTFNSGIIPIYVAYSNANPLIQDNLIKGSSYGINISYGSPRIENNIFAPTSGYSTGAIHCVTLSARPVIRGNTFICSNAIVTLSGIPDLGTDLDSDPGNNDFSAVTGACVVHNGDAIVDAVGNIWPIPIPLFGTHILHNSSGDVVWWEQISSGNVNINNLSGYDFSAATAGDVSHGDFYYYTSAGVPYEFFANNSGMQGLVNVGSSISLNRVQIPTSGYYKYGVPVAKGSYFVSPGEVGEDNHYIIFENTGGNSTYTGVRYIYVRIQ
ncbi:MAG: DUF1565 domain-containing protein [Planctomycetes bacterium]|nr:DUF1565 domain-containing protein [Planctomycetota bacterium]